MNAWMNDEKCTQLTEWMYEWRNEKFRENRGSVSSGLLHRLCVSKLTHVLMAM